MIIFGFLAYFCLFFPTLILVAVRHKQYFVQVNGFKTTMGFSVAILTIVLLFTVGFKKIGKIIWVTLLLVAVWGLDAIMKDALPLSFTLWLGVILFTIFELPFNYFKKRNSNYVDQMDREEAKQVFAEEKKINGGV